MAAAATKPHVHATIRNSLSEDSSSTGSTGAGPGASFTGRNESSRLLSTQPPTETGSRSASGSRSLHVARRLSLMSGQLKRHPCT